MYNLNTKFYTMTVNWKQVHQLDHAPTCDIHANAIRRFFCRLHHSVIPHEHNNNYPHIVRPRALITYSAALIILKLFVTGILFVTIPTQGFLSQEIINRVYALTNQSRLENGVETLALNPSLVEAAEFKAQDMVAKGYFSHYTPEGNPPWYFIDRNKYPYTIAGENLAMNFTNANTVHNAFLASPSHRKNILDERFTEVGFAVAHGNINGVETQVLVEFFGKRPEIVTPPPAVIATPEPGAEEPRPVTTFQEESPAAVAGATQEADMFQYSNELLVFATAAEQETFAVTLYRWSNYLFMFFLAFLLVSLTVNVIVHIRIQHGHLVVQTLLVILLVTGLLYIRIHFIEGIPLDLNIN